MQLFMHTHMSTRKHLPSDQEAEQNFLPQVKAALTILQNISCVTNCCQLQMQD